MKPFTFALLSFAALAAPASAQTTWYVDGSATPPGSGTTLQPFTSIQQALLHPALASGDVIEVRPGVYAELLTYPSKSVTVRSQAGPTLTKIEPDAPLLDVGAIVDLGGLPHRRIDGFTISGAKVASSVGVRGSTSTVRNCILSGHKEDAAHSLFSGSGVVSDYDLWIHGCTITGNAKAFTIEHVAAVYALNTILQGNSIYDLDPGTSGSISTFDYTLVGAAPAPGTGNIAGDPRFWNPVEGDLRLGPASPCIDSGDPSAPHDPDGSQRDIGALVFDADYAPGPIVFCTAKLNSDGCLPRIAFSGRATAGGTEPFIVSASDEVAGKAGLLFFGPGKRSQPFQGGLHCVALPTKRVGVQLAQGAGPCGGTYSFDFGAYLASGTSPLLFPGALVACQWWSRDPLDPSGWGTGLSDALFFGVAP